ncbi:TPA: hypothetical protein RY491_001335 [Escherichia albertii]|uniref:hypothetical protein n=1 Tax=Escherichia albertii TaxID=208962 RepID=UPI0013311572|nr:hypothetical protein [Escherichia albertii]KAF0950476.1 hypothetical protein AQU20_06005 [Escherichia albertii]HEB1020557.1 hypothetical protein [Escherichia albertii]HEB1091671.1 hypothetical protein [Escherichia albertii]HEB1096783.1 hypothetical protein [Escherichia albertii]HEB1120541.1 hypothetical protein [Escherichia albertii]
MDKAPYANLVVETQGIVTAKHEDVVSLDDRINTKLAPPDSIEAWMVRIYMMSFEHDMYDKDNPISPYHKLEW